MFHTIVCIEIAWFSFYFAYNTVGHFKDRLVRSKATCSFEQNIAEISNRHLHIFLFASLWRHLLFFLLSLHWNCVVLLLLCEITRSAISKTNSSWPRQRVLLNKILRRLRFQNRHLHIFCVCITVETTFVLSLCPCR